MRPLWQGHVRHRRGLMSTARTTGKRQELGRSKRCLGRKSEAALNAIGKTEARRGIHLLEVGPAGSTPSLGKPSTWGSGRTEDVPFEGNINHTHRDGKLCQHNLNR